MKHIGKMTYIILLIGLADLVSTVWVLKCMDAAEANPIMSFFLGHGTAAFVIAKLLMLVIPLGIMEMARRRHPQFVNRALRVTAIAYVCLYMVGVVRANTNTPAPPNAATIESERQVAWDNLMKAVEARRTRASLNIKVAQDENNAINSQGISPSSAMPMPETLNEEIVPG